MCSACAGKEHSLQRRAIDVHEPTEVPPIVYEVLRSPGQPLDPEVRAYLEPRFGQDFSEIRVHTDAKAAESARAVNALAYTVGRDIALASGQYAPNAHVGRRLLGHELAHTLQQASPAHSQRLWLHDVQVPGEGGRKESGRGTAAGYHLSPGDRRTLNAFEQGATRLVFDNSLDPAKIVVQESSLMTAPRGQYFRTLPNVVFVPPGSLNSITAKTLVHELTHCWQYNRGMGIEVIITAGRNYDYGGEEGLRKASRAGKHFTEFSTEQQGDILADYYERRMNGKSVDAWLPFVIQVQGADRMSAAAEWP